MSSSDESDEEETYKEEIIDPEKSSNDPISETTNTQLIDTPNNIKDFYSLKDEKMDKTKIDMLNSWINIIQLFEIKENINSELKLIMGDNYELFLKIIDGLKKKVKNNLMNQLNNNFKFDIDTESRDISESLNEFKIDKKVILETKTNTLRIIEDDDFDTYKYKFQSELTSVKKFRIILENVMQVDD